MSTIRDVARRAGVAPITVSRVLNHAGPVQAETRARVERAIAELNYVPNNLARSFRSKRTETLALVLTDITNPFWTRVARGVEDVARQAGYSLILCNTDEDEQIQAQTIHLLLQKQVDGLLLVPRHSSPALIERIRHQQVPVVVLDRRVEGIPVDVVRGDSEGGAYQLARLLIENGHRRIALLGGPADVPTAADRAAGFRRALAEAGCLADSLVIFGEYSYASGQAMALQALGHAPRPSALFAGNNLIATGALHAVRASGLQVPEQVSLVCFDDFPPELLVEPFFTTAMQPAYELGRQAAQLLLDRLADMPPEGRTPRVPAEPREIVLPVELITRRSSGPAR
jgi:LacI family transcriptional regulator